MRTAIRRNSLRAASRRRAAWRARRGRAGAERGALARVHYTGSRQSAVDSRQSQSSVSVVSPSRQVRVVSPSRQSESTSLNTGSRGPSLASARLHVGDRDRVVPEAGCRSIRQAARASASTAQSRRCGPHDKLKDDRIRPAHVPLICVRLLVAADGGPVCPAAGQAHRVAHRHRRHRRDDGRERAGADAGRGRDRRPRHRRRRHGRRHRRAVRVGRDRSTPRGRSSCRASSTPTRTRRWCSTAAWPTTWR